MDYSYPPSTTPFTVYVKARDNVTLDAIGCPTLADVWKTEFEQRVKPGPAALGRVGVITKDADGHTVARHTHDDDTGAWLGPFEDGEQPDEWHLFGDAK